MTFFFAYQNVNFDTQLAFEMGFFFRIGFSVYRFMLLTLLKLYYYLCYFDYKRSQKYLVFNPSI